MDDLNQENLADDLYSSNRRWYDKDPVLSKAMATLEKSEDKIQIQIALNLIKIVIEHKIEQEDVTSVEDILSSVNDASNALQGKKQRWYDLNETLRAAILMLQNCPDDLQKRIARDMAELVSRILQENDN
ncbi:MAG: hypothetical protein AB1782_14435 [Cyanobacteriota bacterium]